MTGLDTATDDEGIDINDDELRKTIRSALEEGGEVYREVKVTDDITVSLDWDTDERILPVVVHFTGDRVPGTVASALGDVSAEHDGLQADLDAAFHREMDFGKKDYGNRADYRLVTEESRDDYVCYDGHIFNPSPAAPA